MIQRVVELWLSPGPNHAIKPEKQFAIGANTEGIPISGASLQ